MERSSTPDSSTLTTGLRHSINDDETVLKEPTTPNYAFKLTGPKLIIVLREAWAELVSVCILATVCCATACYGKIYGSPAMYIASGLLVPSTISALVSSFGVISGAHLNPAMSLAFYLSPAVDFCLVELVAYVIAQLLGAIIGAGFVRAILPAEFIAGATNETIYVGETLLSPGVSRASGVFAEMLSTFILVTVALLVVPQNNAARDLYAMDAASNAIHRGFKPTVLSPFAPATNFAFYAIMGALVFFCAPLTGASFNPARSFGPAIVGGNWDNHWIYWVGPCIGAAIAVPFSLTLVPIKTTINNHPLKSTLESKTVIP